WNRKSDSGGCKAGFSRTWTSRRADAADCRRSGHKQGPPPLLLPQQGTALQGSIHGGLRQVIPQINEIFDADQPLLDKIRTFAVRYTTLLMENHYLPGFIIQEINNNPNFAAEYLTPERRPNPQKLLSQI